MKELLHLFLILSAKMIESGAEVSRVEYNIKRMCAAYGATATHIYATTAVLVATAEFEGESFTETYSPAPVSNDMDYLTRVNRLIAKIRKSAPSADEIRTEIENLPHTKYSICVSALAQGLIAGSFCIFFGGRSVLECLLAVLFGTALGFLRRGLAKISANRLLISFALSFLFCFFALCCQKLRVVAQADYMIIGYIMNLIPGLGITGALRDLFVGDVFTGMSRLLEALLLAASLALGFILAALSLGGVS